MHIYSTKVENYYSEMMFIFYLLKVTENQSFFYSISKWNLLLKSQRVHSKEMEKYRALRLM